MKLHVQTLLDFNGKYSLKDKLHIYNLINQEVLIHNILKRFPSLKKRSDGLQNYQTLVTLRFGNYSFRKTYLKWIYNHFSDSVPNRQQIHKNEAISLINWAKHFNQNSRHLKFLTIGIVSDDLSLKAYLKVSGLSSVNNNVSFKISDAIKAEYPEDDSSSFYQFEKVSGRQIVNALQTNFNQCVSGFPFSLINEAPNNKNMATLKPKPHKTHFNNEFKPSEVNSMSDSQVTKRSESSHSGLNASEVSASKALHSEYAKELKSSMLLSKASSASSSLAESISQSKAARAKSQSLSQSLSISTSVSASSSAAQSKSISQSLDIASLSYSYSSAKSHQVSLAKSKASSQVSDVKRSLSISASASEAFRESESQSQSLSRANRASVSSKHNYVGSSFRSQSIRIKSPAFSSKSKSSKASQMSQSSSSQNLKSDNSSVSYNNKSVSNSSSSNKASKSNEGHVKWRVEKLRRPKVIPAIITILVIVIIGILLFEMQKNGIIN